MSNSHLRDSICVHTFLSCTQVRGIAFLFCTRARGTVRCGLVIDLRQPGLALACVGASLHRLAFAYLSFTCVGMSFHGLQEQALALAYISSRCGGLIPH